jgi:hypothetical protein
MLSKVRFLVLMAALIAFLLPPTHAAADGFPPLGAWAYGSGSSFHSHYRSRYRTSFYRSSYWPSSRVSYALSGPLVRHHGFYRGYSSMHVSYYAPPIPYFSYYPAYNFAPYAYYPTCYPNYSIPVIVPQVMAPQVIVPTFMPTCLDLPSSTVPSFSSQLFLSSSSQPSSASTTQFVSTVPSTAEAIPSELLAAADSILRSGGYREAAIAYARLTVHFGSSDALLTRRFIAQVASGDFAQAGVIAASAELAGFRLDRSSLPNGSLIGLGLAVSLIDQTNEALAAQAFRQSDPETLVTLGTWLHLAGDEQKSQLFLAGAAQIAGEISQETSDLESKTELVSID